MAIDISSYIGQVRYSSGSNPIDAYLKGSEMKSAREYREGQTELAREQLALDKKKYEDQKRKSLIQSQTNNIIKPALEVLRNDSSLTSEEKSKRMEEVLSSVPEANDNYKGVKFMFEDRKIKFSQIYNKNNAKTMTDARVREYIMNSNQDMEASGYIGENGQINIDSLEPISENPIDKKRPSATNYSSVFKTLVDDGASPEKADKLAKSMLKDFDSSFSNRPTPEPSQISDAVSIDSTDKPDDIESFFESELGESFNQEETPEPDPDVDFKNKIISLKEEYKKKKLRTSGPDSILYKRYENEYKNKIDALRSEIGSYKKKSNSSSKTYKFTDEKSAEDADRNGLIPKGSKVEVNGKIFIAD